MTIKLASVKTDLQREADGEWIDVPELPGVAFLVRSLNYPPYRLARDQQLQKFARTFGKKPVPADEMRSEMDIHHYHPATGEFITSGQGDPSPLEPDVWLVPDSATLIAPPAPASGKARVFADGAWSLVDDHRGETWWGEDRQPVVIETLGDPADAGLSLEEPPPPPPTPAQVDAERDRRISSGLFTFGGVPYQTRDEDRENISGAATAALGAMMNGASPGDFLWHGGTEPFLWIAADNSLVPMDAQTVFALGQAAMAHKTAHIFAARALKDTSPIPVDFAADEHWPPSS